MTLERGIDLISNSERNIEKADTFQPGLQQPDTIPPHQNRLMEPLFLLHTIRLMKTVLLHDLIWLLHEMLQQPKEQLSSYIQTHQFNDSIYPLIFILLKKFKTTVISFI